MKTNQRNTIVINSDVSMKQKGEILTNANHNKTISQKAVQWLHLTATFIRADPLHFAFMIFQLSQRSRTYDSYLIS